MPSSTPHQRSFAPRWRVEGIRCSAGHRTSAASSMPVVLRSIASAPSTSPNRHTLIVSTVASICFRAPRAKGACLPPTEKRAPLWGGVRSAGME
jgi:hypothetical protein